ncbi:hypothetical protein FDUTEX481_04282 [Tolypothrix sp. PCC 7601]|nr:hypothetical protein FDUTEX481_04282 [Tolypothrix sp. PCC 7601]
MIQLGGNLFQLWAEILHKIKLNLVSRKSEFSKYFLLSICYF